METALFTIYLGQVLWLMSIIPPALEKLRQEVYCESEDALGYYSKTLSQEQALWSGLWQSDIQQVHLCCLSGLISQYGFYPVPQTDRIFLVSVTLVNLEETTLGG